MYTTIMEGRVGIALACTVSRNYSVASVVDTVRACAHRVVEVLQSVIIIKRQMPLCQNMFGQLAWGRTGGRRGAYAVNRYTSPRLHQCVTKLR